MKSLHRVWVALLLISGAVLAPVAGPSASAADPVITIDSFAGALVPGGDVAFEVTVAYDGITPDCSAGCTMMIVDPPLDWYSIGITCPVGWGGGGDFCSSPGAVGAGSYGFDVRRSLHPVVGDTASVTAKFFPDGGTAFQTTRVVDVVGSGDGANLVVPEATFDNGDGTFTSGFSLFSNGTASCAGANEYCEVLFSNVPGGTVVALDCDTLGSSWLRVDNTCRSTNPDSYLVTDKGTGFALTHNGPANSDIRLTFRDGDGAVVATASQSDPFTQRTALVSEVGFGTTKAAKAPGDTIDFGVTLVQTGGDSTGTTVTADLRRGLDPDLHFQSIVTPDDGAWKCDTPAIGETGIVSCTATAIVDGNATHGFQITATEPAVKADVMIPVEVSSDQFPAGGTFTDDNGIIHEGFIEVIASEKVSSGCEADKFCPFDDITRGQFASLIAKALVLPATSTDFFKDDNNTTHEANINRVAAAGIVSGKSDDEFDPFGPLTRAQMATILTRAFHYPAPATDPFTDTDGSVHKTNIASLAQARVTLGCAANEYCPDDSVTRAQLATFLAKAVGLAPLPPASK